VGNGALICRLGHQYQFVRDLTDGVLRERPARAV